MFGDDIVSYIKQSITDPVNTTYDYQPDMPDLQISVFVYATPLHRDGALTRHMQVQVRAPHPLQAAELAWCLSYLLDSGDDEDVINLTPNRHCICRPTARPKLMHRDAKNRTIYSAI